MFVVYQWQERDSIYQKEKNLCYCLMGCLSTFHVLYTREEFNLFFFLFSLHSQLCWHH